MFLRNFVAFATLASSIAGYIPGTAPKGYEKGDLVKVYANKIESPDTAIPYDYHHFDFCKIDEKTEHKDIALGERLFGDIPELTAYPLKFLEDEECTVLCTREYNDENKGELNKLHNAIKEKYRHNLRIDNLDVIYPNPLPDSINIRIPMGDKNYSYNHYDFVIEYHVSTDPSPQLKGKKLIVGAKLNLHSKESCKAQNKHAYVVNVKQIQYSYSVQWVKSDKEWKSRWDIYTHIPNANVRWLTIANSIAIVIVLTGFIAIILVRTVYRDIIRYNSQLATDNEEDYGWKLVHGDVFRTPNKSLLLSTFVGSGVQIFLMCFSCSLFIFLHLISKKQRGSIAAAFVMFFVCMGAFGGYVSAKFYKSMGGERWKSLSVATSLLVPGVNFILFVILNAILYVEESSNAIGHFNMFLIFLLWFGGSVPLTFFGSYLGFKQEPWPVVVRVNPIPREIPRQAMLYQTLPNVMLAGVLPFAAIFMELYFLFNSLWNHRIYVLPVFLFIVFILLVVTCCEIAILLCYFQLCGENYHWWWRSFFTSSAVAIYFFLYSIYYYLCSQLEHGVTTVLYFGFMLMISSLFFVMTGSIGVLSCYTFVRKIYGAVKVD